MKRLTLSRAKVALSALVDEAERGEVVVITKNGRPKAKLVALAPEDRPRTKRRFGYWGRMYGYRAPEAFPDTSQEEVVLWEEGAVFPDSKT